jgi:hypothetical protein
MKFVIYSAVAVMFAFSGVARGDTLSLVGGSSGNFEMGWFAETWKNGNWCGDTLVRDSSPDTSIEEPDTLRDYLESFPTPDTVFITKQQAYVDSLMITTTTLHQQTVLRDSAGDAFIDIINTYTTIIDSSIVVPCSNLDFIVDTGGITEGATYFDYYYKFRDYWAQLPFVWNNWQGYDSATVNFYDTLLITYKGLLPTHQIKMNFFYATWNTLADTMATNQKRGDGVGILAASPDEWKTVIIPIPDSVQLTSITGIVLAIENVPDGGGDSTSEVGNLKIDRISLVSPYTSVRHSVFRRGVRQDRYHFTPATTGEVRVSVYALNGALLGTKLLRVDPSRSYSVRRLAKLLGGVTPPDGIRIVTVRGAGVNLNAKIR